MAPGPASFGVGSPSGEVLTFPQGFEAAASWWYEIPTGEHLEIWCYTDQMSYEVGDEIAFHVHTTGAEYSVEIYRDGAERGVVYEREGLVGTAHDTPRDAYVRGCGWPVAFTVPVDEAWRSGGYVAVVRTRRGDEERFHHHWFAVRPTQDPTDRSILLVAATSTWIAYNGWGGASHYEGIAGSDGDRYSPLLSIERPWGRGTAWLPRGAPRIPIDLPIEPGWVPRYPVLEWAFSRSFPKYYAAAGWAMYERHFVEWAERTGYRVDVITQHDLHFRPDILDRYPSIVIVGHDEYWTWEMRDHIEAYLDGGGAVARFGSNFLWQIRLEEGGRLQRCHKYDAATDDPIAGTDDERFITSAWEDATVGRPGALTLGLNGMCGCYVRVGGFNPRSSGGFTVHRPEHWAFQGTDLYYGDQFGAEVGLFGYEVDGLAYMIIDGLPVPLGGNGPPSDSIEILAMGIAAFVEEDHGNEGTCLFVGEGDACYAATIRYGDPSPGNVAKVNRGSGMIVTYRRGDGFVFNAGTAEWVSGLRLGDRACETVTRNVLDRMLGGVR